MTESPVLRPMRVFMMATMAVALFNVMNVFVKLASESHAVVEIMFFRNALALFPVLMLMQAHPMGFGLLKTKRPFGHFARAGVGTISMVCFFWSFVLLPLADATAIQFAMPLVLTALSVPFLGERVGPWRWSAVVVGLIGVLVIVNPGGSTDLIGSGVALLAAVLSAFAMLMIRRLGSTEHALTIVFYFSLCGTILTGLALPWFWTPPTLSSFIYLCLTGLTGGAAQVFLTKAYAEAPAAYVSPFNYLGIVFAAGFGWAIWGDVPQTNVVIGAAIVMASGLFILYRETVRHSHVVADSVYAEPSVAPTELDTAEDAGQETGVVTYQHPEELKKTGT